MAKVKFEDVKDLLNQLDRFLCKAYSAYVHTGAWMHEEPRITMDEVSALQARIRLITEIEDGTNG